MKGKTISEFIDNLYSNPEMEIEYHGMHYFVSGYFDENNSEFVLQVDSIEQQSTEVFFVRGKTSNACAEAFEKAALFDGKTIYEAESEITVLYG